MFRYATGWTQFQKQSPEARDIQKNSLAPEFDWQVSELTVTAEIFPFSLVNPKKANQKRYLGAYQQLLSAGAQQELPAFRSPPEIVAWMGNTSGHSTVNRMICTGNMNRGCRSTLADLGANHPIVVPETHFWPKRSRISAQPATKIARSFRAPF
jgi:hypothetical protein